MAATSRPPLVLGPDGLSQNLQAGDVLRVPSYPVASLPTLAAADKGALAYASNGRAITGGALAALQFQAAGAGTGCHVSWSGSAWQVIGTASTVTA